jgi:hypothetical protein
VHTPSAPCPPLASSHTHLGACMVAVSGFACRRDRGGRACSAVHSCPTARSARPRSAWHGSGDHACSCTTPNRHGTRRRVQLRAWVGAHASTGNPAPACETQCAAGAAEGEQGERTDEGSMTDCLCLAWRGQSPAERLWHPELTVRLPHSLTRMILVCAGHLSPHSTVLHSPLTLQHGVSDVRVQHAARSVTQQGSQSYIQRWH